MISQVRCYGRGCVDEFLSWLTSSDVLLLLGCVLLIEREWEVSNFFFCSLSLVSKRNWRVDETIWRGRQTSSCPSFSFVLREVGKENRRVLEHKCSLSQGNVCRSSSSCSCGSSFCLSLSLSLSRRHIAYLLLCCFSISMIHSSSSIIYVIYLAMRNVFELARRSFLHSIAVEKRLRACAVAPDLKTFSLRCDQPADLLKFEQSEG